MTYLKYLKYQNLCQIFSGFIALEKSILRFGHQNYDNIKPLENCKALKHLELKFYSLNEKCLEGFHLYLPKLRKLVLDLCRVSIINIFQYFKNWQNLKV